MPTLTRIIDYLKSIGGSEGRTFSVDIDGNTRLTLDDVLDDIGGMWAAAGGAFTVTLGGTARTDLAAALLALANMELTTFTTKSSGAV